jgi:hypothetical protein
MKESHDTVVSGGQAARLQETEDFQKPKVCWALWLMPVILAT